MVYNTFSQHSFNVISKSLPDRFTEFVSKERLFVSDDKLFLAVSGGVDSVVLCELCHRAGMDFTILHCNFQLRGPESERDENFVRSLAVYYGKKLHVKRFDTKKYSEEQKVSIQVAARELRYQWFVEKMDEWKLATPAHRGHCLLLTAHHADDNAETLLMNFFRGTGVAGIRGILPAHSHFIRPLLFATKLELMRFAKESRLSWVEDSSNLSDDYTRNYIRHQVIPAVRDVFPKFEENLQDNLERFREIEMLYHQSIDYHKKRLMYVKDNEVHLPVLMLSQAKPLNTIVYEILKDFGFSVAQTREVIHLLDSESGRFVESATHRVIRNRKWLIIAPVSTEEAETIVLEAPVKFMATSDFSFTMEETDRPNELPTDSSIACLDRELLKFPLILRKWKQGDYFYPLGMKKKKKVSRFLIDLKLSKTQKEKVWVLEMNKKIVWVVGQRIDDRYKVTDSTNAVLLFKATSL